MRYARYSQTSQTINNQSTQSPINSLTFDQVFKAYVWGWHNLADRLGRDIPNEGMILQKRLTSAIAP